MDSYFGNDIFDLDMDSEYMDVFDIHGHLRDPFVPVFSPSPQKCHNDYMTGMISNEEDMTLINPDSIFRENGHMAMITPDFFFEEKCNDFNLDSDMEDVFNVPNEESILIHINGQDLVFTEPPQSEKSSKAIHVIELDHNYASKITGLDFGVEKVDPKDIYETPPDTPEEDIIPEGRQKLRSSTIKTKKAQAVLNVAVTKALSPKKSVKRKRRTTKNVEAPLPKCSRTSNKSSVCKPVNSQKRTKNGKTENTKKKSPKGRTDHSANERIRREILKQRFTSLRERVPIQCMLTEKDKPTALISKQKVLTGTVKYITAMMEERHQYKRSIRRIFKQCKVLKKAHHRLYKRICKRHRK